MSGILKTVQDSLEITRNLSPILLLEVSLSRHSWKRDASRMGGIQQVGFEDLRDSFYHKPILQCPNFNLPFILTTDAFASAIGVVLSLCKIGEDFPVSFASRTLNRAEMNFLHQRGNVSLLFFSQTIFDTIYMAESSSWWPNTNVDTLSRNVADQALSSSVLLIMAEQKNVKVRLTFLLWPHYPLNLNVPRNAWKYWIYNLICAVC